MSKKTEEVVNGSHVDETQPAEQQQPAESGHPAYVAELLKNGTAILTAKTREELAELVDNIPADCKYCVGAVGRKQDGSAYTLRVDKI